jgi:hypothetical protein
MLLSPLSSAGRFRDESIILLSPILEHAPGHDGHSVQSVIYPLTDIGDLVVFRIWKVYPAKREASYWTSSFMTQTSVGVNSCQDGLIDMCLEVKNQVSDNYLGDMNLLELLPAYCWFCRNELLSIYTLNWLQGELLMVTFLTEGYHQSQQALYTLCTEIHDMDSNTPIYIDHLTHHPSPQPSSS